MTKVQRNTLVVMSNIVVYSMKEQRNYCVMISSQVLPWLFHGDGESTQWHWHKAWLCMLWENQWEIAQQVGSFCSTLFSLVSAVFGLVELELRIRNNLQWPLQKSCSLAVALLAMHRFHYARCLSSVNKCVWVGVIECLCVCVECVWVWRLLLCNAKFASHCWFLPELNECELLNERGTEVGVCGGGWWMSECIRLLCALPRDVFNETTTNKKLNGAKFEIRLRQSQ